MEHKKKDDLADTLLQTVSYIKKTSKENIGIELYDCNLII